MKAKVILTVGCALAAADLLPAKPPADLQARLDRWIAGQPGGVAAAWVDAEGTAFFQAGRFSADDARAITPDTQFEIGSVTKVFTALLLAESERLGRVSRHDAAAKYLLPPADPAQPALAKITLLTLTTHTSGLPRLPGNIGQGVDGNPNPYANYERASLIGALRQHGPAATAGRKVAYSNFGVSVLGEALGAAWGTSYDEALREQVLAPLGLKATSLGLTGAPAPADLAPAHAGGRQVPNWTWLAAAPCGGLRSSTRDLAGFLSACLKPTGPLRAAIEATMQPQRDDEDSGGKIGLGWMLAGTAERPLAWHNGATGGSHSFIAFNPKEGTGLVILANLQKGSERLGFELMGVEPPKPPASSVGNAADYPGLYPLVPGFSIAITEVAGTLFAQGTGQPRIPLRPVGTDRFSIVGIDAEISFSRGPDGQVATMTLHQNSRELRGPRTALPKGVTLPPETLSEYPGRYQVAPTFVLTVTVENGAVFVQATNQPKLPVQASAKDEFFYTGVDAKISFQRNDAGRVTGLVLRQNGRELPGPKEP